VNSAAAAPARLPRRADVPARHRRDVLLLLGPCVAYLLAFSVFPLGYSLYVAFCSYDQKSGDLTYVGLANFRELLSSDTFWEATRNTAFFTFGGVALQVVLGTALALFFDQKLRGAAIVRGILILPMLLTPIVVGLMWRALLNPDWGLATWVAHKLGFGNPQWLSNPGTALRVLLVVDTWQWMPFVFVVVYARLQALPHDVFEAASVDGATWWARTRQITLPLLMPAIVFAAVFRGIDAFRTFDLVYGLTGGGPGQATTTLSFEAFRSGFSFFRYGYASAVSYFMVVVASIGITLLFRLVRVRRSEEW
jgi:multiple sugar transport system permease protein